MSPSSSSQTSSPSLPRCTVGEPSRKRAWRMCHTMKTSIRCQRRRINGSPAPARPAKAATVRPSGSKSHAACENGAPDVDVGDQPRQAHQEQPPRSDNDRDQVPGGDEQRPEDTYSEPEGGPPPARGAGGLCGHLPRVAGVAGAGQHERRASLFPPPRCQHRGRMSRPCHTDGGQAPSEADVPGRAGHPSSSGTTNSTSDDARRRDTALVTGSEGL